MLPQNTTHLTQRPCYQRESPCKDPAGNRTTRRPHYHCKETQIAVVLSCLLFIRSGQNHLARHSGRGKKTRQTKEEVGRQHQGMDRPGVRQVPQMAKTGCKVILGAPTILTVKGQMRGEEMRENCRSIDWVCQLLYVTLRQIPQCLKRTNQKCY